MTKLKTTILAIAVIAVAFVVGNSPAAAQYGGAQYGQVSFDYYRPNAQPASYSQYAECAEQSGCAEIGCGLTGCPDYCACPTCRSWTTWGSVELLLWWSKGRATPPLVTTGPNTQPRPDAGVLGQPGTQIAFGNERIGTDLRSGGRISFGAWLDGCRNFGVGARFFGMEGDSTQYFDSSTGDPIIARPFVNVGTGLENSLLVAFPGENQGFISAISSHDVFGTEVYGQMLIDRGRCYRVDLLGGYQYSRIDDGLTILSQTEALVPLGPFPANTVFDIADIFDADNEFHGGVVGVEAKIYRRHWTMTLLGKVGVGNMNQQVSINGSTVITQPPAAPSTSQGGLLALPTNIGVYERNKEAIIPEVGITLARRLNNCWSVSIGYSAIYWSDVALAPDQIDRTINPSQLNGNPLIGAPRPAFAFRDTEFWVQGLNFGLHGTF